MRSLGAPVVHDGREMHVGASISIALAPQDGMGPQTLSSRADAALYHAKRQGRGSVAVWKTSADAEVAVPTAQCRADGDLPTLKHTSRIVA
ncbi:diguanylate cyclase domain-containing protein [Pseudolabrys taiwanensis]|uniref:diguanylate cyclase domain-containing protein n=1 Tax=Pseudolabrys taiwanensis TaxID=331696 RepID=UPI003CCAE4CF